MEPSCRQQKQRVSKSCSPTPSRTFITPRRQILLRAAKNGEECFLWRIECGVRKASPEGHVERLEQIFEATGKACAWQDVRRHHWNFEEGKEIMERTMPATRLWTQVLLLLRRQSSTTRSRATGHCELGRRTGHEGCFRSLLDQTPQEEIKTDQLLTKLATSAYQRKAARFLRSAGKRTSRRAALKALPASLCTSPISAKRILAKLRDQIHERRVVSCRNLPAARR